MGFNWQAVQSTIRRICLQCVGIHLPGFLRPFNDGHRYFMLRQLRRQIFAGILLGGFSGQIAFAQGLNPNQALFMQGLAASGGQVNAGNVNSLNPNALSNLKVQLPDSLESNANQVKKTKDQEAVVAKNKEPTALNTFQTYLLQTIGKSFPIYGQKLFQLDNPYATIETTNIPIDYVLGPGDELQVKIYSSAIDLDQRFVINRDGMIVLPKLGPLALAGLRVGDVENHLKTRLSQSLTDFNVYVSMGQLRGIEVYLTGQARIPGKHNLSSVSTLVSALFATGGPASNGSMREIQLLRGGKQVASIDLYDFIQKGNKGIDVRLLPGDVIHILPIGPQVVLMGAIPTQAIFELPRKKMSTIEDVVSMAGGLTAFTSPYLASLERVNKMLEDPLVLQNLQLDANGLKTTLQDGDILNLYPIKPSFNNLISLRILNSPIIRKPMPKENTRVTDIIPNKESLLTTEYFYRRFNFGLVEIPTGDQIGSNNPNYPSGKSELVFGVESTRDGLKDDLARIKNNALLDQINFESVTIERIEPGTFKSQLISFNLERAIANPQSSDNIHLLPGDTITIFNQKDILVPLERQMRVVRIQGEVNAPGIYQTNGSETLRDVIKKAGGFTSNAYLFGTELTRQSIKQAQKKNLEVVIKRLEEQASFELRQSSTNLQTDQVALQALRTQNQVRLREKITLLRNAIPTGRLALELDPKSTQLPDVALENGDELLIPSTPSIVTVLGAVYNENALLYRPGRNVSEYLKSAGVNQNADREAIFVVRADGTLQSSDLEKVFFKTKLDKIDLNPGDTIVVPEKIISESGYSAFMRGLKDWTQVLFQLGLSAATIKVLK
jgi:protein involved in polysaccharide export with SLBB domain